MSLIVNVKENVSPKKIGSVFKSGREVHELVFKIHGGNPSEIDESNEMLTEFLKNLDISKFVCLDF